MESAGRAVAVVLADRYPHLLRAGVLVAAGPGNNGGDGWVVARALHRLEVPVWVASAGPGSELRERMARLARAEGVREVAPDGPWPAVGLAVDALLGTGATGAPACRVAALLERLLDLEVPVVAVDGPTGVDLLTGIVHGVTARRSHRDLRRIPPRPPAGAGRGGRRRGRRHRPPARRSGLARAWSPTCRPRSGCAGSGPGITRATAAGWWWSAATPG